MTDDIIVMASDGLFDNLEISEIISIIAAWENENKKNKIGVYDDRSTTQITGDVSHTNSSYSLRCKELAKSLVLAAREASLNKEKDRYC
jgi:hypothetical protein